MSPPAEPVKRLQIRKYPNRRYYDSTRSTHLTLEQIYSLIREGYEIEVVDSKTGQDITAKVLAQIIIDLDSPKLDVFPVTMLHRLLQSNTQMVGQFIEKYFNQPLSAFLSSPWGVGEYLRQAASHPSQASGGTDWTRLPWGPFNPSFWTRSPSDSQTPASDTAALRTEIESLRQQIADIQSVRKAEASARRKAKK